MRIRIVQRPTEDYIAGVRLDKFIPGEQYEVGNTFAAVLLAEGWAEPVDDFAPALVIPLKELYGDDDVGLRLPNLLRETHSPSHDGLPAIALDRRCRPRNHPK